MKHGLKRNSQRWNDALSRTGWEEVERLLAVYYRGQGWSVDHCGTGAVGRAGSKFDGGIDLKLRRSNEYVIVQAKHWNAYKVPHNEIHQMIGLMVNEGATGAIVVTSGEFTHAAIEAANKLGHVHLVDGAAIREMIGPLPEPRADAPSKNAADAVDEFLNVASGYRNAGGRNRRAGSVSSKVLAAAGHQAKLTAQVFLLKTLVAIVSALVFLWLVKSAIAQLNSIGTVRTNAAPVAEQMSRNSYTESPAREVQPSARQLSNPTVDSNGISVMGPGAQRLAVPPGCVVVDHFSGTYSCPSSERSPTRHEPSAAELRESKRRSDEAMKVLEGKIQDI